MAAPSQSRGGQSAPLLDFAEYDVHVGEGDALAVNHAAVLAELGPVFAVHLLAGGACVAVDGEAAEGLFQRGQLHRRRRAGASVAGAVGLGGEPLGRAVLGLLCVRPERRRRHVGVFCRLDFKVVTVVSEKGREEKTLFYGHRVLFPYKWMGWGFSALDLIKRSNLMGLISCH